MAAEPGPFASVHPALNPKVVGHTGYGRLRQYGEGNMHILLVEDNEHDIFFVREALKRIEHRIELSVVTDGAQALDFLSRREPYT